MMASAACTVLEAGSVSVLPNKCLTCVQYCFFSRAEVKGTKNEDNDTKNGDERYLWHCTECP